jgi:hypothetical protein
LAGTRSWGLKVLLNGNFIWRRAHTFRALLAVALVTCTGASARDAATSIDVGKNEIGAAPAKFNFSREQWTVVPDATIETGIAFGQSAAPTADDMYMEAIRWDNAAELFDQCSHEKLASLAKTHDRPSAKSARQIKPTGEQGQLNLRRT